MGCVYILKNPAMPDLIKIGQTEKTAREQANELYTTGVPLPFKVLHEYPCDDHEQLGREIHQKLAPYRYDAKREFFKYPADDAYQLLKDLQDRSYRRWTSHYLTRFKKKTETQ